MSRAALVRSALFGAMAMSGSAGCFSQDATLGLPCDTARGCGRQQACIDGTCQATGEEPRYCPLQDDVVSIASELPASTNEILPTNALDVLGECGSLGGSQAIYLWQPPVSGTFAVRLLADAAFFETADVLPPLHLRIGGCEGDLATCDEAEGGARSFKANRDEVVVLVVDNLREDADPEAIGFKLAIDDAEYCLTGGELAPTVPIVVQGTTGGSQNLIQPSTCAGTRGGGFGRDVALSWTAPRDGLFAFTASSADADVLLYLLSDDCGGAQLACSTDLGYSGTASSTLELERDQQVVVVVDTSTEVAASFSLTIDEAFGCVPVQNDLGFQFPPGGLVVPAVKAQDTPIITCAPEDAPQLLYRWTAPAAGFYTFSTVGSDMSVILSVLEDSCSGAVVGCDEGFVAELDLLNDGIITLPLDTGESVVLAAAPAELLGSVVLTLEQTPCGSQLLATPLPISQRGEVDPRNHGPLTCDGNRPSPEDAVFSWRAPSDGVYEFAVTPDDAAVELALYVQDESCAGLASGCELAAAPSILLDLRAQETVAVGIAAPPGDAPIPYTLEIREAP